MAKKKLSYNDIMKLADDYGVKENVLFASAAARYASQTEMIEKLREDIDQNGLMIDHITSSGAVNKEMNPLASQLPKYNDTANKTLGLMLDIIGKLGTAAPAGDKLGDFLNE